MNLVIRRRIKRQATKQEEQEEAPQKRFGLAAGRTRAAERRATMERTPNRGEVGTGENRATKKPNIGKITLNGKSVCRTTPIAPPIP